MVPLEMTACLEAKAREPRAEMLGAGGGRGRGARGGPTGGVPAPQALPPQPAAALACGHLVPTRGRLVPRPLLLGWPRLAQEARSWTCDSRAGGVMALASSAEPQRRERQRGTSLVLWCGYFIVSPGCL